MVISGGAIDVSPLFFPPAAAAGALPAVLAGGSFDFLRPDC